uniref:uncharacterized protein LOC120335743 n=1 Tax=Styela clava TaxID=7725 RepID=UPI00193A7072|nr:uncharacterized protein LOC120335743 [Styela clava]
MNPDFNEQVSPKTLEHNGIFSELVSSMVDELANKRSMKESDKAIESQIFKPSHSLKENALRQSENYLKTISLFTSFGWLRLSQHIPSDGRPAQMEKILFRSLHQTKKLIKSFSLKEKNCLAEEVLLPLVNTFTTTVWEQLSDNNELSSKNQAKLLFELAKCYEELEAYHEFKEINGEGIRIMEDRYGEKSVQYKLYGKILNNQSIALINLGQKQEAEDMFAKTIEVKKQATDYTNDAERKKCIGNSVEALEACKNQIKVYSERADLHMSKYAKLSRLEVTSEASNSFRAKAISSGSIGFDRCSLTFTKGALLPFTEINAQLDFDYKNIPEGFIAISPILSIKPGTTDLQKYIGVELPTWCTTTCEGIKISVMCKKWDDNDEWKEIGQVDLDNSETVTFKINHFSWYAIFLNVSSIMKRFSSFLSWAVGSLIYYKIRALVYYTKNFRQLAILLCGDHDATEERCHELLEKNGYSRALPLADQIAIQLGSSVEVKLKSTKPVNNIEFILDLRVEEQMPRGHCQRYFNLSEELSSERELEFEYTISSEGHVRISHTILLMKGGNQSASSNAMARVRQPPNVSYHIAKVDSASFHGSNAGTSQNKKTE